MVQVYARLDPSDPASYFLSVVAAAEPMPRAISLTWGEQTFEAALSADGDGRLGPVPVAALERQDAPAGAFTLRLLNE
jgi:hypothetical protein